MSPEIDSFHSKVTILCVCVWLYYEAMQHGKIASVFDQAAKWDSNEQSSFTTAYFTAHIFPNGFLRNGSRAHVSMSKHRRRICAAEQAGITLYEFS